MGFFWTSGGMYGAEPILQMCGGAMVWLCVTRRRGPPAHVFVTMAATVLVYLIPAALISVDIAIAYPMDGGFVAWIDEALGATIGAQAMYWCVPSNHSAPLTPPVAGRGSHTSSTAPSIRC